VYALIKRRRQLGVVSDLCIERKLRLERKRGRSPQIINSTATTGM